MQQDVHPHVTTATGCLRGRIVNGVAEYRGVPYAAAPVGELRFAPPRPAESWQGVREAVDDGPIAPQTASRVYASMGALDADQGEDCLYLSIWAPVGDQTGRPVVVWFHGGGFMTGAGSAPWYDGARLAQKCDAVVVGVNYRLGALGFLAVPGVVDGNLAILDQALALKWVQANIAAFGGDARLVTVMGQSGGGHNIASLLTMPETQGHFARAIFMSPPLGIGLQSQQQAARTSQVFLEQCDIQPERADVAECLHQLPVERILAAQGNTARALGNMENGDLRPPFMPCEAAPHSSSWLSSAAQAIVSRDIDVMVGWTREEANLFYFGNETLREIDEVGVSERIDRLPYGSREDLLDIVKKRRPMGAPSQWYMDGVADVTFRLPCLDFVNAISAQGKDTYVYQFDWQSPCAELGASHCIDLPFFFGTFDAWKDAALLAGADASSYEPVSAQAMAMLKKFLHDGRPDWQPWNGMESSVHHLG